MDQRISLISIAVADIAASRSFYVDGLGWSVHLEADGEVVMISVGERLMLSLWDAASFESEVGERMQGAGVPPFTLAHNVATADAVQPILETARAAGATLVQDAVLREWGGTSGYFADPDGVRWEIAHNPGAEFAHLVPAA